MKAHEYWSVGALLTMLGTFYSRGCRNRLIKSIYLQKCTVHDKLRTVHFCSILRFLNFSNKKLSVIIF